MRAFFLLILFGCSSFLTSCAQRIDELETRIEDLDQRARILESKSGLPVGSDRELLEGQNLADVKSQLAALKNDVTVMKSKMEAVEYEQKALEEKYNRLSQKTRLDERARELNQVEPSGDPAEALYRQALELHQSGDFERSRELFLKFIKEYPKNSFADNAVYWMGESYFIEKAYRKALVRFQDLIEKFPDSDKKCDAMDRQVEAFEALGMKEEAKAYADVRTQECRKQ